MPATFDEAFALWLTQHGSARAVAVNVLEFKHPKWGTLFVTDFGEPFEAQTEEPPLAFTALPLGFSLSIAADNVSTEQRVQIKVDNVNGLVGSQLRSLTDEDIQTPVEVVYRVYLDTDREAPQIDPLSLLVTNVTLTRLVSELEASADLLPNVSAGTRYTIDEFPTLVYL